MPSSIAALLIGSVPLWVILLRAAAPATGAPRASVGAVLVGFAGVALLLRPGEQSGDATVLGLLACVGAARDVGVAARSPRRACRSRATRSSPSGWQMLLGGIV